MTRAYRWICAAGAVVVVAAATVVSIRHSSTTLPRDPTPNVQRISTAMSAPEGSQTEIVDDGLAGEFTGLQGRVEATVGIAMSAVGSSAPPVLLGDWSSGPAWSTMKVPVVMTALRASGSPVANAEMTAAITQSDNAAAETVWASLGDPSTAARKVEAVLAEFGDTTVVQHEKVRPEYSAFGQTDWPLANQSRFLSAAACDSRSDPVLALMGAVAPDQRWGLGAIPGTKFKGGWGPSVSGDYLLRQIALIPTPSGLSAVAVAAQPNSGSYEDGIVNLTEVADWLTAHNAALPAGHCQPS